MHWAPDLCRHRALSQLTDKDARDAGASLSRLQIALLAPEAGRVARTTEIARKKEATFHDAAHIQGAEESEALLITADEAQLEAPGGMVRAIHPRDTAPGHVTGFQDR